MKWLKKLVSNKQTQRDPNQSNAYDRIGGERVIQALARQFYLQMHILPETQPLLAMHRSPISESEQKLFEFLSGWLGGPQLYQQKYGHPALRARHMPFAIDKALRDQWLLCMKKAIEIEISEAQHQQAIYQAISTLADHMRNQVETD
ncbi:group II truncated hemoglobin [Shewanella sp. Isolate11]|uniref:group II truncated hemoglobin n=1 Tax=Shewanella sp. Isolate11 TaxID=2908530 RepID=UPI001EFE0A53|nr:group II truncated hemoglobin [Shewanella sp. Isolate11]MCG9698376.1 group II truncated hemoglobin [Shewanella sp. Isolate11]